MWPGLSDEGHIALAAAAAMLNRADRVEWLPQYGCAIVALGMLPLTAAARANAASADAADIRPCTEDVSLFVVGLDNWQFRCHR